jgi:hypothetical protein
MKVQIRHGKEKGLYIGCCVFGTELSIEAPEKEPTSFELLSLFSKSVRSKTKKSDWLRVQVVSRLWAVQRCRAGCERCEAERERLSNDCCQWSLLVGRDLTTP